MKVWFVIAVKPYRAWILAKIEAGLAPCYIDRLDVLTKINSLKLMVSYDVDDFKDLNTKNMLSELGLLEVLT